MTSYLIIFIFGLLRGWALAYLSCTLTHTVVTGLTLSLVDANIYTDVLLDVVYCRRFFIINSTGFKVLKKRGWLELGNE